ncbi:MAG: DNA polymerase III subunit delta [Acidobacteriota bacterium]
MTGRDHYWRDAIVQELRRVTVDEGFEAFDDLSLSGEAVTGTEVVEHVDRFPMGGRYRLVRVRAAERLREKDAKVIAAYAEAPAPRSKLILVCQQSKAPIIAALRRVALHLDCPAPRDYQLAGWLEGHARRLGLTLEAGAAQALAQMMGEDFIAVMSEMQRAIIEAGGRKPVVTCSRIRQIGAKGRDANPFHFSEAILSGEPVRAIRILRDLHDAGGSGYAILGMLESQLRRFLEMRSRVDAGESARRVVQSTSAVLPASIKNRLARELESFDRSRLARAFAIARSTDRAIKSYGSASELGHMEMLVWRMCAR